MLPKHHSSHLLHKAAVAAIISAFLCTSAAYAQRKKITDRLENAGIVLKEATRMPEQLPSDLISRASCIIVIPSSLKGAFIFGLNYGRGVVPYRRRQSGTLGRSADGGPGRSEFRIAAWRAGHRLHFGAHESPGAGLTPLEQV